MNSIIAIGFVWHDMDIQFQIKIKLKHLCQNVNVHQISSKIPFLFLNCCPSQQRSLLTRATVRTTSTTYSLHSSSSVQEYLKHGSPPRIPSEHNKHHHNNHHGDYVGDVEGVQVHPDKEIPEKETEDSNRDTECCHDFEVIDKWTIWGFWIWVCW